MNRLCVACVQLNSGPEFGPNLEAAARLVKKAADDGARLICLPENASMMIHGEGRALARAALEPDHPAIPVFCELAQETGTWILVGSLNIRLGNDRIANRSFLISAEGAIEERYDKLHLFDVDLPAGPDGKPEIYRESALVRAGQAAVLAHTPWGGLGLSICYDLRFPQLYRALAGAGARMIAVPAAFTRQTGQAHWEVLLRARAVETGAFILAPAQCGKHDGGRQTFGHSMIIDPWGQVLARAGGRPGIIMAELDLDAVDRARQALPSLQHDRAFLPPRPAADG